MSAEMLLGKHGRLAPHQLLVLCCLDPANFFGNASGKLLPVCWRTTTSLALQHLALSKGFLPEACLENFSQPGEDVGVS